MGKGAWLIGTFGKFCGVDLSNNLPVGSIPDSLSASNLHLVDLLELDVYDVGIGFEAFFSLEIRDNKFGEELSKGKWLPASNDWDYACQVLPFLKLFNDTTVKVSGSSYVTSNDLANDVFGISGMINEYLENEDRSLQEMAKMIEDKIRQILWQCKQHQSYFVHNLYT